MIWKGQEICAAWIQRSCHLLSLLEVVLLDTFGLTDGYFLQKKLTFEVLQKPADWICSASDVDKKKGRKLDPNEDLRNKGFKAREIVEKPAEFAQNVS